MITDWKTHEQKQFQQDLKRKEEWGSFKKTTFM
jgi:hypothetical protein